MHSTKIKENIAYQWLFAHSNNIFLIQYIADQWLPLEKNFSDSCDKQNPPLGLEITNMEFAYSNNIFFVHTRY